MQEVIFRRRPRIHFLRELVLFKYSIGPPCIAEKYLKKNEKCVVKIFYIKKTFRSDRRLGLGSHLDCCFYTHPITLLKFSENVNFIAPYVYERKNGEISEK